MKVKFGDFSVGGEEGQNSFPSNCQFCTQSERDPSMMKFLAILATEVARNELDQRLAGSYK